MRRSKRKRRPTLREESEMLEREMIRRLLAAPPEKRLNFLRVRLPEGGSAL